MKPLQTACFLAWIASCGGTIDPPHERDASDDRAIVDARQSEDDAQPAFACVIDLERYACGDSTWMWRTAPGSDDAGWTACTLARCRDGDRCKLATSTREGTCSSGR